jgi:hypothetical protein
MTGVYREIDGGPRGGEEGSEMTETTEVLAETGSSAGPVMKRTCGVKSDGTALAVARVTQIVHLLASWWPAGSGLPPEGKTPEALPRPLCRYWYTCTARATSVFTSVTHDRATTAITRSICFTAYSSTTRLAARS